MAQIFRLLTPFPPVFATPLKAFAIIISLLAATMPQILYSQTGNPPGNPSFGLNDIPPGHLRAGIEALPPGPRERALEALRNRKFPGQDLAFLRVDQSGVIFYEEAVFDLDEIEESSEAAPALSEAPLDENATFSLHSKPGASRVVYLDMDGHVVTGTVWNNQPGVADTLYMRPYDTESGDDVFTQNELNDIAETWKRVAEDFAPFDIDVTTEEPASFGPNVGHILVTRKADKFNNSIYTCNCGGVAYLGVWGNSNYTYYQPALVFLDGVGGPHSISEAASHELGHNLNLYHDGTTSTSYYLGHGAGNTDWAPIMGAGYYAQVTQWSKGEYLNANNTEDDLAIISARLNYTADDHADIDFNLATPLTVTNSVDVLASNPVSDPSNINQANKGVIEDRSDIDLFYLDVDAGLIDLTITPAWIENFSAQSRRGANLDIMATLYNQSGSIIDQDEPTDDTFANINANVAAGHYALAIEGVYTGSPLTSSPTGYTDYASIGQYFINGTVPASVGVTGPPPAPGNLAAALDGETNILLNWTDPVSTAENNEAGYRIFRQVDAGGFMEIASIAGNSQSYADNNLANGSYQYYVQPYNSVGQADSNMTEPIEVAAPLYAYVASETNIDGAILSGSYLDTVSSNGFEELTERHQGGKPKNRVSSLEHTWEIIGIQPGATVTLEIDAEAPSNTEGDDFQFSYAENGGSENPAGIIINGTSRQTLSTTLTPGLYGDLSIRVKDTDRTVGRSGRDTIKIHRIRVISSGNPGDLPPTVTITAPADGSSVNLSEVITFSATANDEEDGNLSSSITWVSDLDGGIGNGSSLVYSSLTAGTHTITASVPDSASQTGQDSVRITVTDPDAATGLYVSDLIGTGVLSARGGKWSANVTVTVIDNSGEPVPDATVTGRWSNGTNGTSSCTTNGSGQCLLSKSNLKSNTNSVTLTVDNIAHTAYSYDSGSNTITEITVTKP